MEHNDKIFYHHQEQEGNETNQEDLGRGPHTPRERGLFQGLGRSASTGMRHPSGLPITSREIETQRIMKRGEEE